MQQVVFAADDHHEPDDAPPEVQSSADRVLEHIELPVPRASVLLPSGLRVEVNAGEPDNLVVRARDGRLMLHVELTESGARLRLEGAELELQATRRVSIAAEEVSIEARRAMSISSGGDLSERVAGNHHSNISGDERLEAAAVQLQANKDAVEVRAAARIALDGDHIGLNDDLCPAPFSWSSVAVELDGNAPGNE